MILLGSVVAFINICSKFYIYNNEFRVSPLLSQHGMLLGGQWRRWHPNMKVAMNVLS